MPRIRYIKPEFSFDEELAKLPVETRLFFILSWCHMDRDGRAKDEPSRLRALIYPYEPQIDANDILGQLHPKFILRYEVDGIKYLQINQSAWKNHQRPHVKEQPSTIPAPNKHLTSTYLAPNKHAGDGDGDGDGDGELGIGRTTAPSAVDLSTIHPQLVDKSIDSYLNRKTDTELLEQRIPSHFSSFGGVHIINLSAEHCQNLLDNAPRLSENLKRGLALRVRVANEENNTRRK